jgi:2-iminobutanoate/2-iminopropanoate deaminase
MKKQVSTDKAPSAPNFLSQAVTSSGFIFVSGQVHTLPDNTLVDGSTKDKVDQIMKNIQAILGSANATLDNIVKVVIYVTDMSVMPELNEVYPSYFTEPYPVREAICVNALPLGAQIEISVIAAQETTL